MHLQSIKANETISCNTCIKIADIIVTHSVGVISGRLRIDKQKIDAAASQNDRTELLDLLK